MFPRRGFAGGVRGCIAVLGTAYFTRQILTLLKFAQSTSDPKFAAVLLDKALDLKSQAEEVPPSPDIGPQPPDVEREKSPRWPGTLLPDLQMRADRS